jgi:hypothetical protein
MSMKILRKITAKTVAPDLLAEFPAYEGPIFSVVGFATGTKEGESTYGTWQGLTGSFRAIHAVSGEHSVSDTLILPEPISSLLCEQVSSLAQGGVVEIAVEVGIKPNAREPKTKYEYVTRMLNPPKISDAFLNLLKYVPNAHVDDSHLLGHDGGSEDLEEGEVKHGGKKKK